MLHLLNDQQTIKFTNGNKINLNLLKNQIDRRILKITTMVTHHFDQSTKSGKGDKNVNCCQSSCQTLVQDKNIEIDFSQCSNKVLRKIDSNLLNARSKSNHFRYGQKMKDTNYLILSGKNEPVITVKQTHKQRENVSKQKDNSLQELDLELSNIKFDEDISYQEQASHIKSYIRETLSNRKKFAMTDRKNVQSQIQGKNQSQLRVKTHKYSIKHDFLEMKELNKIVVVNSDCFKKMQEQVQTLVKQKRVYQTDNKVRANLLKKVQQKFKSNIS